jgi:hypothetical protein
MARKFAQMVGPCLSCWGSSIRRLVDPDAWLVIVVVLAALALIYYLPGESERQTSCRADDPGTTVLATRIEYCGLAAKYLLSLAPTGG